MTIVFVRRTRRSVWSLLAAGSVLLAPTSASAAVETFYRFEENATANWTVTTICPDQTTRQTLVTVIAGRELESPDLDDVNTFATVLIRGFDCDFNLINERGSGPVTYTSSPSLQEAHVTGTIPLISGSAATIDVTWEGTGKLETNVNQTQFPGFTGIFTSKERDATASGTVVVDGVTLVSGSTDNASIETLEDRNTTLPS